MSFSSFCFMVSSSLVPMTTGCAAPALQPFVREETLPGAAFAPVIGVIARSLSDCSRYCGDCVETCTVTGDRRGEADIVPICVYSS